MHIQALIHMASALSAMAPDIRVIVFGSCSALCAHPELAVETEAYDNTLDADFIFDPWSPEKAAMLNNAFGRESDFFALNKYYADINRPQIFSNFPADFRDRLVPLPGCPNVSALDPHDMAIAKLFAGRPKDLQLLSILLATGRLDEAKVRRLLWRMEMEEKWIVKTNRFLDDIVEAAWALGYPLRNVKDTWQHS